MAPLHCRHISLGPGQLAVSANLAIKLQVRLVSPPPSFRSPPRSTENFFPFKSNHLALRLNSLINTVYFMSNAEFSFINNLSLSRHVLFSLTVERTSRCCVWDSSTRQRNIHHHRGPLIFFLIVIGAKKRRHHCQKFYSLNDISFFFVCGTDDLQSET